MMEHQPVNCPKCGVRMHYVERRGFVRWQLKTDPPAATTPQVCECPEHGLFHFGQTTHLTQQGPPPIQYVEHRRHNIAGRESS